MNTKKAILTIEKLKLESKGEIISLLQQGEKYKKYKVIVEKYKEYLDKLPTGCDSFKFYRLLKKYFPKEMIK